MKPELYPIQCMPIYKDYLWGGDRISNIYPNHTPPTNYCAESWEISDRSNDMSLIANGEWSGKTLREYIASAPTEILGTACKTKQFPLLIKLIDAKKDLSIQVHPNPETAKERATESKEEMWYFLNEATQIIHGLSSGTTIKKFQEALEDNTLAALLQTLCVQPHQAVFTPGGCVHSIGAGNLLLEIQNNSNTTYRIHDWNRLDSHGKPRELHPKNALHTIDWNPPSSSPFLEPTLLSSSTEYKIYELLTCHFFSVEKLTLNGTHHTELTRESFHTLFIAEGHLTLTWGTGSQKTEPGTTLLIPAALPSYTLFGTGTVIRAMLPKTNTQTYS